MRFREASEEDLPRLVELWSEMMRQHREFEPRVELTPIAPAAYQSYLLAHCRGAKSLILIAENEEGIQGFCCAYVCQNLPMLAPGEFGYISDMYVAPAFQSQGIGSEMLARIRSWFQERGQKSIQLQVYRENEKGIAFWKAKGFRPFFERMWLDIN